MARTKKSKTKAQVRKWRDKPMEPIKPKSEKSEYIVIMPGCQMQIKSDLNFEDFIKSIHKMISEGVVTLMPESDNYFCMTISNSQHFPFSIMTLHRFTRMQAEQRFAQMGQQGRAQ